MGNCVSQTGHKEFLKSLQSSASASGETAAFPFDDPQSFRVFVKKRNKFIPGTLKVTENEIVFARNRSDMLRWPLHYLRRYGFTSAGTNSISECLQASSTSAYTTHYNRAANRLLNNNANDNNNDIIQQNVLLFKRPRSLATPTHNSSLWTLTQQSPHHYFHNNSDTNNNINHNVAGDIVNERILERHQSESHPTTAKQQVLENGVALTSKGLLSSKSLDHWYVNIDSSKFQKRHNLGNYHHAKTHLPSYSLNSMPSALLAPLPSTANSVIRGETNSNKIISTINNNITALNNNIWNSLPNRSISETNSPAGDKFFYGRYVNVKEMVPTPNSMILTSSNEAREPTPPQLDYASVNVGTAGVNDVTANGAISSTQTIRRNSSNVITNCNDSNNNNTTLQNDSLNATSPSMSNGIVVVPSQTCSSNVNYAKIDLERTHAVEVAANASEKENPHRRHFMNGGSMAP
ncbi:unnamed protein product [Anisakis simplex]|uniref:HSF_DOMAIN domain-containing protein n=1 Tax=Anisakis simplex TaxID=6269 RepID=A0A0M3JQR2_ANISI|nr:unnamed protein product [Anisakis simplex]